MKPVSQRVIFGPLSIAASVTTAYILDMSIERDMKMWDRNTCIPTPIGGMMGIDAIQRKENCQLQLHEWAWILNCVKQAKLTLPALTCKKNVAAVET